MDDGMSEMQVLAGRVVLITGAGGGVGYGMAHACAAAGARVMVTARNESQGTGVVKEITERGGEARFARCDVTERAEVDAAVASALEQFGRLDAFIHNATSNRSPEPHSIEDVETPLLAAHTSVSLRAAYYCAQASFEALCAQQGHFVVLTSPAGIEGSPTLPLYSAVKAGQRAFMKSLAKEWGPHGIQVNAICPLAATPALVRAFEANPTLQQQLEALTPLGRVGDPEHDIGAAAVLLLSPGSHYITGQTLVVDGGRFLGL
jgi:3-oxoacyl-[acyl-carrier protein] reductase